MNHKVSQQIVPGISVTPTGQATVDSSASQVLIELALALEEPTNLPVDVEHVLAAVVLAVRAGEICSSTRLSAEDPKLIEILTGQVKAVFENYGGSLGEDD